jgi:hypothetical protein
VVFHGDGQSGVAVMMFLKPPHHVKKHGAADAPSPHAWDDRDNPYEAALPRLVGQQGIP